MRILLVLLRKDCANFVRDRVALSLTFIVPIALIYIFGFVFGLNSKSSDGPSGIRLAVVNQSGHPASAKLVDALKAEKAFRVWTKRLNPDKSERLLTEADVRAMIDQNELRFAVVIPADVIREDAIGIQLKILSNPQNEIETQTVNGLLQKTIFSSVPELLGQSLQSQARKAIGDSGLAQFNRGMAEVIASAFDGDKAAIQRSMERGDFGLSGAFSAASDRTATGNSSIGNALTNLVKIETEQVVGKQVKSPAATRVVGGWAMMFLLFALSGSASAFFEEKKTGIFQRLLAAPVRRSHLLWSRFIFGVLLGLVQLTTLFCAGRVMYGIDVFGHLGNLIVICTAAAAACTAFAMLLVSITPTAAAASGLATFLVLTMSACGGAWFPISLMPPVMQDVAKFTIVYWSMEGFTQVLWAGKSFTQILPTVGVLWAIAAGVMALALWRFNRGRLFD
jgi:ABC-2 type transport system permease protein